MTEEQNQEKTTARSRVAIPPGAMAILPLRNAVLFPSTVMPLAVGRRSSLQVLDEAVRQNIAVGFVTQRDANIEKPQASDLYSIGTAANVLRMFSLPDGQRQIIIQGQQRFEIAEILQSDPYFIARVTLIEEGVPKTRPFEARILNLRQEAVKALSLLPEPMQELRSTIERIDNPLALIDIIASTLDLPASEKQ